MHKNEKPKTAAQLVADARTRVESLTPEQVAAEVERGALLIDLRESEERTEHGCIAGAVHAARGMLEFWADPASSLHRTEFDPKRRIIVHCMAGGRSSLAADTLQQIGYANVAHMEGGFERWAKEGRPVQGGHAAAQLIDRLLEDFEGKLTSSKWAAITKCSADTALRDINELVASGMLKKSESDGRSTHYELILPILAL